MEWKAIRFPRFSNGNGQPSAAASASFEAIPPSRIRMSSSSELATNFFFTTPPSRANSSTFPLLSREKFRTGMPNPCRTAHRCGRFPVANDGIAPSVLTRSVKKKEIAPREENVGSRPKIIFRRSGREEEITAAGATKSGCMRDTSWNSRAIGEIFLISDPAVAEIAYEMDKFPS